MDVPIPAELEQFVQSVLKSGTYSNPAEVVGEALQLLKKREQFRRDVAAGVEQLDRGEYTEYDENSRDRFVTDVKDKQRERSAPPPEEA